MTFASHVATATASLEDPRLRMTACSCDESTVIEMPHADLLPALFIAVRELDGEPFDLTGWTLTLEMLGPVSVSSSATAGTDGVIQHDWTTGQTDMPGDYVMQVRGTAPAPDGRQQTFRVLQMLRVMPA